MILSLRIRSSRIAASGAFLALLAFGWTTAASADDLSCLWRLEGQVLRWDADWQVDHQDDRVRYRVTSVSSASGIGNQQQAVISLAAIDQAVQRNRTAHVLREHVARLICDHADSGKTDIAAAAAVTRAQRLADFRNKHQRIIDRLLNEQLDPEQLPDRQRYQKAIAEEDYSGAEAILTRAESQLARHTSR